MSESVPVKATRAYRRRTSDNTTTTTPGEPASSSRPMPEVFTPDSRGWRWRPDFPCPVCHSACRGALLTTGELLCGSRSGPYMLARSLGRALGAPTVHRSGGCPCGQAHAAPAV